MKRYRDYMDRAEPSEELHRRLCGLSAPRRAPGRRRHAAVAAVLVAAVGLGVLGAMGPGLPRNSGKTEIGTSAERIEPAPAPSGGEAGSAYETRISGGYEVIEGETAAYYLLPALEYGPLSAEAASIALPDGVERRDLTGNELAAVFGGNDVLEQHLNWGSYTLNAFAMEYPDGSLWMLCVYGSRGSSGLEHFELNICPGKLPPACIMYGAEEVNRVWGVEVVASGSGSGEVFSRRVSFLANGYGCRFDLVGQERDEIEELSARLVRFGVLEGFFPQEGDSCVQTTETQSPVPSDAQTSAYDPQTAASG